MKVKAVKVNRAHYFLTDPRIIDRRNIEKFKRNFYKKTYLIFIF